MASIYTSRVARIFFPDRRNPHNSKDSCNGNDG
uniref:Uncharacterized protein n=1 Tax=Arundo donax TaxID=35708 RepID=A0A0A9SDC0_ARUDO